MSLLNAWKELPMFRPDNKKRRYKLKLNGDYIEGEGLDNNPRLSLKYLLMIFMTHIRTELILR